MFPRRPIRSSPHRVRVFLIPDAPSNGATIMAPLSLTKALAILLAVDAILTSTDFKKASGATWFNNTLTVKAGSYYVDSTRTFTRPVDLTVEMKQISSGGAQCGIVALFPTSTARHSGYNAGVGWGGNVFGTAVAGAISKPANGVYATNWNTVRINAAKDGKVYFFVNGVLKKTETNRKYNSGVIRLGNNCRDYLYRNVRVRSSGAPYGLIEH